jgi:hydroxymethylpyrimidine kinase / phosphomethylpyrimidine kinase / thiamine-phosphate diphosphorylase
MTSQQAIVWTIAASDSGGGAGIQADIKTFADLGVYGCSAITAITAQNTRGVKKVAPVTVELLAQQLDALLEDLPPVAIKIGVLPNREIIDLVIDYLKKLTDVFVIFDPVIKPSKGQAFIGGDNTKSIDSAEGIDSIEAIKKLLPYVDMVTPNIPEAEHITGMMICGTDNQYQAAQQLLSLGVEAVLLTGGHSDDPAYVQDLLVTRSMAYWLTNNRHATAHTHGSGCVLSSAIAAFVGRHKNIKDAVVLANAYVNKGIVAATALGPAASDGCVQQTGWPDHFEQFPQVSIAANRYNLPPMPSCDTYCLGLYPVVDSIDWLEKLLPLGINTLQLRIKNLAAATVDTVIAKAVDLGRRYHARLFINDYWQQAIKHQAYGVHLGQEDIASADVEAIRNAGLRLGISTHSEFEFCYAATHRPSYLAIGSIFPTQTKEVVEVGLANLYQWANILRHQFPLVAIGGITINNIDKVASSGVGSMAVVSAITLADNYISAVTLLKNKIEGR